MNHDGPKARREYIDAKAARYRGGPDVTKPMQDALSRYLLWYAQASVEGTLTFDPEIAFDLGDALRDTARGHAHPLLLPVPTVGAPPLPFTVEDAKRDAVRYILWSLAGLIDDRAPYKTVCAAFGDLPRPSVRRWAQAMKAAIDVPPSTDADEADRVLAMMKISGSNYNDLPSVRSRESMKRRDSKRKGIAK